MSADASRRGYPKALREGAVRTVSAVTETLLPDGVGRPLWGRPSPFARVFILAALIPIAAGIVILALVPETGTAHWPTWVLALSEFAGLTGLLCGCVLVLHASRDWLLGIPGVAVSLFVTVILGGFAGLTLYAASRAGGPLFYPSTSSALLHISAGLALAGLLAAFLLVAMPWSPRRKMAAPLLVAIAVVTAGVVLWVLPSARSSVGDTGTLPILGIDPLLVVSSLAGLFAIPLAIAGSIEWVSECVRIGSHIACTSPLAKRSRLGRAGLVVAEAVWLGFGVADRLPPWLGGHLAAWALVRDAHPDAWLVVIVLTGLASLFVASVRRPPDLEEATSASYVPSALLYYPSLAGGIFLFYQAVRVVAGAVIPAALPAIIVGFGAYALGVTVLWMPRRRHSLSIPLLATGTGCLAIIAGALLWPVRVIPVLTAVPLARLEYALGRALDSATAVAAAAGLAGVVCVGAWLAWLVFARYNSLTDLDGTPARATGYEAVVLPLGCWLLVLAGASALRMTNGAVASAFTPPVIPDPALFAVAAFPVAAFAAVHPRSQALGEIAVTVLLALPVLAFLPFALPAALGPGGSLAVLAVAAPVAWAVISGASRFRQQPGGERRLCWLVGTTALSVPLLAYLAVATGQRVVVSSLLADTGQGNATVGLGPHLRLVLLLPLFVTLVCSRPTIPAKRSRKTSAPTRRGKEPSAERSRELSRTQPARLPPSRWRDFQADALIFAVRDNELNTLYLDQLRQQLATLSPEQRAQYALALAVRLYRSYPRLKSSPEKAQPSTAARPNYPARTSVKRSLDVARRLHGPNPPGPRAVSNARDRIAGRFETPGGEDRNLRQAYDMIETLRLALADPDNASEASLDVLVTAAQHEIEDAAEMVMHGRQAGRAYDDELARARKTIGQQLASLQEPSSLDELRLKFLWAAPALVLDDPPGVRQGVELPVQRPYVALSMALVIVGILAGLTYLSVALSIALMIAGILAGLVYLWLRVGV